MALLLTDQTGRCIDANQAALRLLSLPHDLALGRNVREFLPEAVTLSRGEAPLSSNPKDVGVVRLCRGSADELRVALSVAILPTSDSPIIAYFFRDITDEAAVIAELRDAARTDPLTGLPNRVALEESLDVTLRSISRGAPSAVLCFLDLDNFKAVNDTCGHAAGDAVLQKVAQVLRERLRATDVIGRIGGDEFAVVLLGCRLDDAERYVASQRRKIAAITNDCLEGTSQIGLSAGMALLTKQTASVAAALEEADRACYAAKTSGRGKTQLFNKQPDGAGSAATATRPQKVDDALPGRRDGRGQPPTGAVAEPRRSWSRTSATSSPLGLLSR